MGALLVALERREGVCDALISYLTHCFDFADNGDSVFDSCQVAWPLDPSNSAESLYKPAMYVLLHYYEFVFLEENLVVQQFKAVK